MTTASNLAAALAAAQGELSNVAEDGRGNFGKYMTLPTLINAVRPILAAHDLSWSALPAIGENGQPTMRYQLLHSSGEALTGEMALMLGKQDAQSQGSALTYARRYALVAVLNIGADEDDDGEHATKTRRQPAKSSAPSTVTLRDDASVQELVDTLVASKPTNDALREKMVALGLTEIPEVMIRDSDGAVNRSPLRRLSGPQALELARWASESETAK